MKKFVVFLGYTEGKSKETGETLYICRLAEVTEEANGRLSGYLKDLYAACRINVSGLQFGSIVEAVFRESKYLGGKPDLIDLKLLTESPYTLLE